MVGALGYVGTEQTLPSLYKYLDSFKSDEAKKDVCSAIGNILAKKPDALLPNFLNKAQQEKDAYHSLVILREMLGFTDKAFGNLIQLIEWLFAKSEDNLEAESNYYIIAECVGRAAFLSTQAEERVLSNSQSTSPRRRFVVASSLRFALESEKDVAEELVERYLEAVGKYFVS